MEPVRSYFPSARLSLDSRRVSSCITRFGACTAFTTCYGLQARQVAIATLYTGGFSGFVTSTAASIATGWSEPVPGRDFHPLWTSAFHGARESRRGAVAVVSRWLMAGLSLRRLNPVWRSPVSSSRSSNRTGAFRASGSRGKVHDVAHGKLRVRLVRRANHFVM